MTKVILARELLPSPQCFPVPATPLKKKIFGFPLQIYMISILRWEVIFYLKHKEAIFKSHTHSVVGLTTAKLGEEFWAMEPHKVSVRGVNSDGTGRERAGAEGRAAEQRPAVLGALVLQPAESICRQWAGRAQILSLVIVVIQGFWNDLPFLTFL